MNNPILVRSILIYFLILISGLATFSQEARIKDETTLRDLIQTKLDSIYDQNTDFGGATMGIVLPDGEKLGFAVGFADVENKIKMKPSDRMLGGSTGKIFVSASIMQLVENGVIDLDDNASKYLEDYPWYTRLQNYDKITVRNLLQHSTGISRYVFSERFQQEIKKDPDRKWRPEELLSYVLDEEPLFQPGEGFAYSDTNYIILGMILERTTGKALYDYVDENIIRPNGLDRISPQIERTIDGLVPGYNGEQDDFYPGKVVENGIYKYNLQFEWAGGGYVMNSMDLAAAGKLIYEGMVFSEDLFSDFYSGIDASGLGGQWGLGVHISKSPSGISYGHSGFFPGYITNMLYFPDHKFSIAFQVNTSDREKIGLYRKLVQSIPDFVTVLE